MMKLLFLPAILSLVAGPVFGQFNADAPSGTRIVQANPNGNACATNTAAALLYHGLLYTCQSGTYGGAIGGTIYSSTLNDQGNTPSKTPGDATVDVANFSFTDESSSTSTTTISVGQTVSWKWISGLHTVVSLSANCGVDPCASLEDQRFDSGEPTSTVGHRFAYTFTRAGTYHYYCDVHGAVMQGTVVVNQVPPFATLTDGSPATWNVASAPYANAKLTLIHTTATRALNVSNLVNGGNYTLLLVQDSTGGAALTLGSGCTWKVASGGAGAVALTGAGNAIDSLSFTYDGTNCYAVLRTNFN